MADSRGRFHPARLVARRDTGGGLTHMMLSTESSVLSSYRSPGQYIEVRADGETGFFVLANEPGAPNWEVILRSGGGASDVLLTLGAGAPLEVSDPVGVGFPMREARAHPLIVALGGSGVAAGPPIIARRVADGDARCTRVLVGIRTGAELPMRDDLEAWTHSGVDVLVCLSKDDGSIDGIPYEHGYIQDVLLARVSKPVPADCRVFVVGTGSMVDAIKRVASELGIAPDHVHTNH